MWGIPAMQYKELICEFRISKYILDKYWPFTKQTRSNYFLDNYVFHITPNFPQETMSHLSKTYQFRHISYPTKQPQSQNRLLSNLLIYARFGVCYLVQAGDLEAICISSLALVHVIAKG